MAEQQESQWGVPKELNSFPLFGVKISVDLNGKNQNNKSESYQCLICLRSLFSVNLKLAVWLVDFDGVTDIVTFCFFQSLFGKL